MDWWTGLGIASLAVSLLIFMGDFVMQYWLVIRWGPGVTKRLVVAEFKDKKTAGEVRDALDLPDRAALTAVTGQMGRLEEKLNAFGVSMDSKMTQMGLAVSNDVRQAVGGVENKISAFRLDPAALADDVKKAMLDSGKALLSREAKAVNQQREEILAAYQASAQAQYDRKYIANMLMSVKVPPGMADVAATYGPAGVDWALRMTFGDKAAEQLMGGIQAAKMAAQPFQPPQMPRGYQ